MAIPAEQLTDEVMREIRKRTRRARGSYRRAMQAMAQTLGEAGYADVRTEIAKSGGSSVSADAVIGSGVIPDVLKAGLRGRAIAWAGITSEELIANIEKTVASALSGPSAAPVGVLKSRLRQTFRGWVANGTVDPATGEALLKAHKVESIAKTETMKAYAEGRISLILDPDADVVQAVEYSAVLDNRTSPLCRGYDGKIIRKTPENESFIREINPPNHERCRSLLLPVTEYDEWESTPKDKYPTRKNREGKRVPMQPQPGFGVLEPDGVTI